MKPLLLTSLAFLLVATSWGQSSLSLSTPMVWSNVKVKDNWTPSTAPYYKGYLTGSTVSYGIGINYSFRPKSIIKNKNISLDIGLGYFVQRFDIHRPFNYNSGIYLVFYTDHYSYLCFRGNIGLTYRHTFSSEKYFARYNVTYGILNSFQQNYTPTHNTGTERVFTQINRRQLDFGRVLSLDVGLNRLIGNGFSIGAYIIAPFYIRWRNDAMFDDDPMTFSKGEFSLGASLSISYNFRSKPSIL